MGPGTRTTVAGAAEDDSIPRERELKLAIPDAADFELLLRRLGEPAEVREQVNHYYDTREGDLLRRRMCLRLREEGGRFILSLKRGRAWKEGYLDADESEAVLPGKVADPVKFNPYAWDVAPAVWVKKELGSRRLEWLGSIANTRRVYMLREGISVELDQTRFPGGRVEYELEAECEDEARVRMVVVHMLDSWGVGWMSQTRTKHERFLALSGEGRVSG